MTVKRNLLLPAAFALGVGLAACQVAHSGRAPAAPRKFIPFATAARTYMARHPVPQIPGMIAGLVAPDEQGQYLISCHGHRGSFASPPGWCTGWTADVMTATGRSVTVSCGRLRRTTTDLCTDKSFVPEPADYVYVPAGLHASRTHRVRLIRWAFDYWDDYGVPAQCFAGVPLTPPGNC